MDEVAATLNLDPIKIPAAPCEGPARYRGHQAAAEKAGWQAHHPRATRRDRAGQVSGRGMAYSQRAGTRVAIVAEVDVDRRTGKKIWARKFTVAHEFTKTYNGRLTKTVEGNIVQGISRTLWEEVKFNQQGR